MKWQTYHWHLEPSSRCTLQCPRCPRTEHPDIGWINKDMTLEFVQSFLSVKQLQTTKRITLCGDVGDPIYCKELIDICSYFKKSNPLIHLYIITNGSYKKPEWWRQLGSILDERDTINFSIDGYDNDSNNLYRVNSDFLSIVNGIKALRESSRVFINWATIVFSFNQDHLQRMQEIATNLGCDGFQITKSTKFGSKYGEAYGADKDQLEPRSEFISSSHRYERQLINLSGRTLDNKSYLKTNEDYFNVVKEEFSNNNITPLCYIGNRGLYVNAEGTLFPCSWTSFPYTSLAYEDKVIKWDNSFFSKYKDRCNLKTRSLDEILNDDMWTKLTNGFTNKSKSWVECSQKCSSHLVDYNYAVGYETN